MKVLVQATAVMGYQLPSKLIFWIVTLSHAAMFETTSGHSDTLHKLGAQLSLSVSWFTEMTGSSQWTECIWTGHG